MDHLALPKRPTRLPPRVPYLHRPYDDGDFLTYPTRFSASVRPHASFKTESRSPFWWVDYLLPSRDKVTFWWADLNAPANDDELAAFFQSWIFFGLLHELLSPYGLYDVTDYIGIDADGSYVHTKLLESKLHAWREATANLNQSDRAAIKDRLADCLNLACESMHFLLAREEFPGSGHPWFNRSVRISLASLCETIEAAARNNLNDVDPEKKLAKVFSIYATYNKHEKDHMTKHGWCPHFIAIAVIRFSSVAARFYLQNMHQPNLGIDHTHCTDEACKRMYVQPESYSPRHVTKDCSCDAIGPDQAYIAQCLDRDNFPILDITGETLSTVSTQPMPYQPDVAYVAISHVWMDGLGNPDANALPRCQLLRLQYFIRNLEGRTFRRGLDAVELIEQRHLHLWLDSLLVPVPRRPPADLDLDQSELEEFNNQPDVTESRRLNTAALSSMRDVYSNASYVLVIDRVLETLRVSDMYPLEVAVRMLTSRWMQRLWTYQEAALPSKLLFQFADEVIDCRDLAVLAGQYLRQGSSLGLDVAGSIGNLRALPQRHEIDLLSLQMSLRIRRVSRPEDEPVCAAALLGLDVSKVAEATDLAARTEVLWRLIAGKQGIPADIIFNQLPRLTVPGFGWAPSSFQQKKLMHHNLHFYMRDSETATLDDLGLHVFRCGWRIVADTGPYGVRGDRDWDVLARNCNWYLHVQHSDGSWCNVFKDARAQWGPDDTLWDLISNNRDVPWYIVLDRDRPRNRIFSRGILGFLERNAAGKQVLQARALITVNHLQPQWTTIEEAAQGHALELRNHQDFRLFQIYHTLDVVAENILWPFPSWISCPLRSGCHNVLAQAATQPLRRFFAQMTSRGGNSAQTEEVMSAMRNLSTPSTKVDTTLSDHIALNFLGRTARITETFDPSHEWCVG